MKKILFLLLIAVCTKGFSQTKNFIDLPYIETSAIADTLVVPNRIHLNIIISERDTKNKYSVEELENSMVQKLSNLRIDTKKNLTLDNLASNFREYSLKKTDVLKSKSFNLVIENAKMAGSVIAELETIDISNIRVTKVENTESEKIKLMLKLKAISKAKIQAEYMTKPLKQKVGNAVFISDLESPKDYNEGIAFHRVLAKGYHQEGEQEFKPIDIEFEKIKIECSVNVKFKLE